MTPRGRPEVGPVHKLRFPPELWAVVVAEAERANVSAARWVRDAILQRIGQEAIERLGQD